MQEGLESYATIDDRFISISLWFCEFMLSLQVNTCIISLHQIYNEAMILCQFYNKPAVPLQAKSFLMTTWF